MSEGLPGNAGMTPAQRELGTIFLRYPLEKHAELRTNKRRFVHYTSAEVAVSIISKKEVWMRTAAAMNDFMEIEHGRECLLSTYNADDRLRGKAFCELLNEAHAGLSDELESILNQWLPEFKWDTYLACLSRT